MSAVDGVSIDGHAIREDRSLQLPNAVCAFGFPENCYNYEHSPGSGRISANSVDVNTTRDQPGSATSHVATRKLGNVRIPRKIASSLMDASRGLIAIAG